MKYIHISIAALMGIIFTGGLSFAAARDASPIGGSLVYTFTYLTLCTAVVGSICSGAGKRPFWAGFAVFGWTYLLLSHDFIHSNADLLPHLLILNYVTLPAYTSRTYSIIKCVSSIWCGFLGGVIADAMARRQTLKAARAVPPQRVATGPEPHVEADGERLHEARLN